MYVHVLYVHTHMRARALTHTLLIEIQTQEGTLSLQNNRIIIILYAMSSVQKHLHT